MSDYNVSQDDEMKSRYECQKCKQKGENSFQ